MQEMRRRAVDRGDRDGPVADPSLVRKIARSVRRVDFYPKYDSENVRSVQTTSGAILSLCTGLVILYLIYCETLAYSKVTRTDHVGVDLKNLHLVVQDVLGNIQESSLDSTKKIPLSASGNPVNISETIEPSSSSSSSSPRSAGLRRDKGCRIEAKINLRKVKGNFHVTLGRAEKLPDGRLVHHFSMADAKMFRAQHTIHELSFGSEYEGRRNALDGHIASVGDSPGHYQYFLKIVPTLFKGRKGNVIDSAQFAVTHQQTPVEVGRRNSAHIIPGVFFVYEISAYMVTVTETQMHWTSFLISVCAVVGGTFTIAGVASAVLHHGVKALGWNKKSSAIAASERRTMRLG
eukprot:jgi/Bigna1/68059/fgenesh1_pg.5_\